jgi:regulator of cell morphogenesis and NO signaling
MSTIESMQVPALNAVNKEENALFELNVTLLEPVIKHSTIFKSFDALQPGEAFCILNDHDPKPLYYQIIAERGNVFTWRYKESGPVWWRVLIQKNGTEVDPTLGKLAAADIRKAEVFKKYGLDFCCGGKKSLRQACEEKNLDVSVIEKELLEVSQTHGKAGFDFNNWQLDFLTDYIYNEHHQYWYNEEPAITELVQKVAGHHGKQHKELLRVNELYLILRHELNTHFLKEEKVLFPHIKQLVAIQENTSAAKAILVNIDEPLQMMEADHEVAGELLSEIRKTTNNYTLPSDACNSFKLLYHKLKSLEEDLHQHVHLENNILFPKASLLHKQIIK